jgi:hypothetical protein
VSPSSRGAHGTGNQLYYSFDQLGHYAIVRLFAFGGFGLERFNFLFGLFMLACRICQGTKGLIKLRPWNFCVVNFVATGHVTTDIDAAATADVYAAALSRFVIGHVCFPSAWFEEYQKIL